MPDANAGVVASRKLELHARYVDFGGGFKAPWISATPGEEDVNSPVETIELLNGVANPYLTMRIVLKDGTRLSESADVSSLVSAWANGMIGDHLNRREQTDDGSTG